MLAIKPVDHSERKAPVGGRRHSTNARNGDGGVEFAPDGPPGLRARVVDGLTVVEFENAKTLLADDAVRELGERLYRLVEEGNTHVLLNFAGVRYISCA